MSNQEISETPEQKRERIREMMRNRRGKCGKLLSECHLECCNELCEGDGCPNCGPDV